MNLIFTGNKGSQQGCEIEHIIGKELKWMFLPSRHKIFNIYLDGKFNNV